MFNSKKLALSGLVLAGVVAGSAIAAPTATVTWGGTVPGSTAANGIVITGLNMDVNPAAMSKTILPEFDGKFVGEPIILEAWEELKDNDGNPTGAPDSSKKAEGIWTLVSTNVIYGGTAISGLDTEVNLTVLSGTGDPASATKAVAGDTVGTSTKTVHSISVDIQQKAALTGVQGKVVQAAVVMDYTDV